MPSVAKKTSANISVLNKDPNTNLGTASATNIASELPGNTVALKNALINIRHKLLACQKSALKNEKISIILAK
ncbi:hypothetical protein NTHiID1_06470 [Haemophilus influenzae]|nr:hypothetical protein CHBNIII6_05400 [Haemophilus influenzae]GBK73256.1 hypothetical protein NTHiID1_06470 [Haemophilus influenzae]